MKEYSRKELKKEEKGVTLVSLIITIVIMLILVAVSIRVIINSDIIGAAEKATNEYETASQEETEIVSNKLTEYVQKTCSHTYSDGVCTKCGYIELAEEGINAPELIEGMIAVEWNGTNWVKADESTNTWYSYTENNKQWANAVTVTSGKRSTYEQATTGTVISMEDILGMYVWIPRYAYKIDNTNYHTNTAGEIKIEFIQGTASNFDTNLNIVAYNNETTEEYTKFPEDGYVEHPAFIEGNKRLSGIWVAKFEASSSSTTESNKNLGSKYGNTGSIGIGQSEVTVRPNVTSWRAITVQNISIACSNITANGNIQGLATTANSHMMTDYEWGAVAYLTQSAYGNMQTSTAGTGVWNNCYYEGDASGSLENKVELGKNAKSGYSQYATTKTGMVGIRSGQTNGRDNNSDYYSVAISKVDNGDGSTTITYQSYKYPSSKKTVVNETWSETNGEWNWGGSTSTYTNTYYEYWTENGVKGSTTGTIYGIYDMAGGAWEYTASYLTELTNNSYVTYFNNNVNVNEKVSYAGNSSDGTVNYPANKNIYGNAIYETSSRSGSDCNSWNGDYSYFVYSSHPFSLRGGYFYDGTNSGIFCFVCNSGLALSGFRPVLCRTL